MMKRVFIALDLPDDLKQVILTAQKKLSKLDRPVRWEPIEKLHITLRFLGNITNEEVVIVQDIVHTEIQKARAFLLTIDGYVLFPNRKHPKVLCLRVVDNTVLYTFQRALAGALTKARLGEPERHLFHGHITIGRVKPVRANYRALTQMKFNEQFDVKQIVVFESVLKTSGSQYYIMGTHNLSDKC